MCKDKRNQGVLETTVEGIAAKGIVAGIPSREDGKRKENFDNVLANVVLPKTPWENNE